MKRLAVLLLVVSACDEWGELADDARCRATACDGGMGGGAAGGSAGGSAGGGAAGGSAGGAAGGSAGGAAGGSAGGAAGGSAGGAAGGSAGGAPGSAIVGVWKSGGVGSRSVTNVGAGAVLFADRFGSTGHVRLLITPDGGVATTAAGDHQVSSAYFFGGRLVVCTNTPVVPGPSTGAVTWVDPVSLQDAFAPAPVNFPLEACNLYPTDAGPEPRVAAWGTRNGGTELVAGDGVFGSSISDGRFGTCDGGIEVHRIRMAPWGGGMLTGSYFGGCVIDGQQLAYGNPASGQGFAARVAVNGAPPPSGFSSSHRTVSEVHDGEHFVALRGLSTVTVGRLASFNNSPTRDPANLPMNATALREPFELVASDAGLLLVGGLRPGQSADRDVTVHKLINHAFSDEQGLVVDAGGDQEVQSAVWLAETGLLAIAGTCRPSMDGGHPPVSALCTGDGGFSSFVLFVDPTQL